MNQHTNQHVSSTKIRFNEPKPIQPKPELKDQTHQFKIRFNPWVMRKNGTSIPKIIKDTCKSIIKKTGNKAVFHSTAKIQLPSDPIEDVSTDFPSSKAELQDFFHMHKCNKRNAEIHLSFKMPGTTEAALHDSKKKFLTQNFLWLTSDELSAKQKDVIGWI